MKNRIQLDADCSPEQLQAYAAEPSVKILQFDGRVDADALNVLAQALNDHVFPSRPDIQLRAYGFSRMPLDLGFLQHLPRLEKLSVDCCDAVVAEEAIAALPRLRELHFDVYDAAGFGFLERLPLSLDALHLGKTRKRGPDLAMLRRHPALRRLGLTGQARGIEHVATLSRLRSLHLSGMPLASLPFVRALSALEHLSLGFGAAEDLSDLSELPALRTLSLLRVKGLTDMGCIATLPQLQSLHVHDQPHVADLPVFDTPTTEISVVLGNVGLTSLDWVGRSTAIRHLAMFQMKHLSPEQVATLLQSPHSLTRLEVGLVRVADARRARESVAASGLAGPAGWWHARAWDAEG